MYIDQSTTQLPVVFYVKSDSDFLTEHKCSMRYLIIYH